nr:MAG TPA: hypothetical protein [Caudoviricetes sp.]
MKYLHEASRSDWTKGRLTAETVGCHYDIRYSLNV